MAHEFTIGERGSTDSEKATAVDRVVAILEVLNGPKRMKLSEVARTAHLNEATALRYLSRLVSHGIVERDEETGRYRLGIRLFQLGQGALRDRDPREVALPIMRDLQLQFDETVNLAARVGDELILIEALESTRSIKKGAKVGESDVWHSSSVGKAILAYLPERNALQILESHGCPGFTPNTLTQIDDLLRDFERVRERGYAIDDQESEEGLCCVGAPILDNQRGPTHALSLSGPAHRFSPTLVHEMGLSVSAAAKAISLKLGHSEEKDGAARAS